MNKISRRGRARYAWRPAVLTWVLLIALSGCAAGRDGDNDRVAQDGVDRNADLATIRAALAVHERHRDRWRTSPDVLGSGLGLGEQGEPEIQVYLSDQSTTVFPAQIDGVAVRPKITGRIYAQRALSCHTVGDRVCTLTERWPAPVPLGVSVGHPLVTAGTFGARVTNGSQTFLLSNNHVLANINLAAIGDRILQPGALDGGSDPQDAVAVLTDFEPLAWCTRRWTQRVCPQLNTIDAAIAAGDADLLGVATPMGEYGAIVGYGVPSDMLHAAYGQPHVLGDEDLGQLLSLPVQKVGRSTGLTVGQVNAVAASVDVCYNTTCTDVARFVDQLLVGGSTFSEGGDSGSLIVSADAALQPVGLLFAGSGTMTVANRIDLVLQRFEVNIDTGVRPPPAPGPDIRRVVIDATSAHWTSVALDEDYRDQMVVVCTPQYDRSTQGPVWVRVKNARDNHFQLGLERPWLRGSPTAHVTARVRCLVLRQGVYRLDDHGVKMEAFKLANVSRSDHRGAWQGQRLSYRHLGGYLRPVVLGQVLSQDTGRPPSVCLGGNTACLRDGSVFWSRGPTVADPPTSDAFYVGRHTGKDTTPREAETLMVVVLEAGSGIVEGHAYLAGVGDTAVRGMDNDPPVSYAFDTALPAASFAVVTQTGMKGIDGSWALLYGTDPIRPAHLEVAVDEDWIVDMERDHPAEQLAYWIFD